MRCTTERLQFLNPGRGGKISRRTGMAKKNSRRGNNMRCTTERLQFLNPGSGGKINRRTGMAKKFAGGII
jgi:hypothetical protein